MTPEKLPDGIRSVFPNGEYSHFGNRQDPLSINLSNITIDSGHRLEERYGLLKHVLSITTVLSTACASIPSLPPACTDATEGLPSRITPGLVLRCSEGRWNLVEPPSPIGKPDPQAGGAIRLTDFAPDSKWPETFRFVQWISEPNYNTLLQKWVRIACASGADGSTCDVLYEVPAPKGNR